MCSLREVSAVIALFVVFVCGQTLATGEQGFSATDEPVAVTVVQKKVSTSPIGSCSTTETSFTFNVRIHSVKSKTTSFSRVLMKMTTIETFASKLGNGTAKHIGGCAEMADKGGFAGFSFIDGLCKMFSLGRQPCRCDAGTGDLIYVRDSFWDKQDRAMPKLVPVGSELMEYVNFPSTVFDQIANNIGRFFFRYRPAVPALNDTEIMAHLSSLPGMYIVVTRGDEMRRSVRVDIEHCSMGCNSSSNLIVRRMFTYKLQVIDETDPQRYFLSECGHTVVLDGNLPMDALLSHKGYGCRWYTKEAEDHECAVTISLTSKIELRFQTLGLDGNSSTCEGDSVTIYSGTREIGNATFCDKKRGPTFNVPAGELVVVFRRSSKQHQPDGVNLGFSLTFDEI